MGKYRLTKAHRAKLAPWRDKWIANAMSTAAMTEEDREICRDAVIRLYRAADLPPPKNIVFVSSPLIARFASGFAAWSWYCRKNAPPNVVTLGTIRDASDSATRKAIHQATHAAINNATDDAIHYATYAATSKATYEAIDAAIRAATHDSTYDATHDAIYVATRDTIHEAITSATDQSVSEVTRDATREATDAATRDVTEAAIHEAIRNATYDDDTEAAIHEAIRTAIRDATGDATNPETYVEINQATDAVIDDATRDATDDSTEDATDEAIIDATDAATGAGIRDAIYVATRDATHEAIGAVTGAGIRAEIYRATDAATNSATRNAIDAATRDATRGMTYAETRDATNNAIYKTIREATYNTIHEAACAETFDATYEATDSATFDATNAVTSTKASAHDATQNLDNWYVVPKDFAVNLRGPGLECTKKSFLFYQGGNFWSSFDAFISFFRHVAKLQINYDKWDAWETLSLHSGPRAVHADFCIISDRPEVLLVDDQNRPHCDSGPFCRWADGFSLYAFRGVRVPAFWIEQRHRLTPELALSQNNIELRRAACELVGWARILTELKSRIIDTDPDPEIGELIEVTLPDSGPERFLRVRCGTGREFAIPVPPTSKTALEANAWTYGFSNPTDYKPEFRT